MRITNDTDPRILDALLIAQDIYGEYVSTLVVTSLNDGKHKVNSKHYTGKAVDIRTKNLPSTVKHLVTKRLVSRLGKSFYVELESLGEPNEHIHIQIED